MKYIIIYLAELPLAIISYISVMIANLITIPINRIVVDLFHLQNFFEDVVGKRYRNQLDDKIWRENNPWKFIGILYLRTFDLIMFNTVVLFPFIMVTILVII